ncbi:copper resistance CopC family protein [Bacillus sp. EB01]|uniref:copper resistance CopC family protein n=1 Tax=Bacillus sp. EB01 TaxID=1347086 RepID=UPI0005C58F59|nr:copper resistance protein CopC [Bacillus sp. EB01]
MQKIVIILAIMVMMLPTIASAHTQLESSTPESGQVVKENLNQIVLNFGGEVESLSTMTLVKDGQEVPFESIEPQGTQMIGTVADPLATGSYIIQWKIVGEDGHIITGEIPFTVQVEQAVEEPEKVGPATEESNNDDTDTVKKGEEDTANPELANTEKSESNLILIIIPIAVLLLLGIGLFLLFRRKK